MPNSKNHIPLRFQGRVYKITPDFNLVREIEDELGGLAELYNRFSQKNWKVSDLVTLVHMMLQSAGKTVDYIFLGNLMLREGIGCYLAAVLSFLQLALHAE